MRTHPPTSTLSATTLLPQCSATGAPTRKSADAVVAPRGDGFEGDFEGVTSPLPRKLSRNFVTFSFCSLPGGAGDFAGVTAPRRLAYYIVSYAFAVLFSFLETRSAVDRGSDVGRPPPPVREHPEEARSPRPGL